VDNAAIDMRTVGVQYSSSGYSNYGNPYEIIDGKIYTDKSAPLDYQYVSKVTNAGLFPALFVEALACRLAMDACEELTQNHQKKEFAAQEYQATIRQARRVNALYNPPRRKSSGAFIQSRFG
jgi:hypothetical protein